MKNFIFGLSIICLLATNDAVATAQQPDIIIYEGKNSLLFSNPLESYYKTKPRPNFYSPHTANWRGYIATWEIDQDILYLKDIEAWIDYGIPNIWEQKIDEKGVIHRYLMNKTGGQRDIRKAGLHDLFPNEDRVKASWFTGQLRIPQGKELKYIHMGYESAYEQDIILTIEAGRVITQKTVDNTTNPPKVSAAVSLLKLATVTIISGIVSVDVVKTIFAKDRAIWRCNSDVEKTQKSHRVILILSINAQGKVATVKLADDQQHVEPWVKCLTEALKTWQLPVVNGQTAEIRLEVE